MVEIQTLHCANAETCFVKIVCFQPKQSYVLQLMKDFKDIKLYLSDLNIP